MGTGYTKHDYQMARADIRLNFSGIALRGNHRIVCPLCRGGSTGERSMSLTGDRDGGVFYCFRAACGFKGQVGTKVAPHSLPQFTPTPYREATRMLTGKEAANLGLTDEQACAAGLRAEIATPGTVVYLCESLAGEHLGQVTRTPDKHIRTYRAQPDLYYSHGIPSPSSLWIVEDALSAAQLGTMWHRLDGPLIAGVALLGTHMLPRVRQDIARYVRKTPMPVYVALDAGAEDKARNILDKLTTDGVSCNFVALTRDVKNLSWGEKETLVRQYTSGRKGT